jgi:probable phosphoglycerate mutase
MTEFLLIRHGETDWNRELRFQGQIDVPLNAIGHEQAQRLRQRIEASLPGWLSESRTPVHVVTSDLVRAQQTAEPLAQVLGHAVETLTGLREQCFGIFEGLQVADIKAQYPEHWSRWLDFDADHAVPEAESTRDFYQRVTQTLHELAQRFRGEHVVVVTHGGVLDMVWRHSKQQNLHGPRLCEIPNAGVNQVRHGPQGVAVLQWADTSHLADMPPQPVYRQTNLRT